MKQLVLVVGVGRSGTSLFAGIMGQLGFHIPQPEVTADETNPRGFGEPKWVVDFHSRIMRRKRVTVFDARPAAWEQTRDTTPEEAAQLRDWLRGELAGPAEVVVVKDPRVSWFLPLWTETARELGAETSFVTMLRHPAQILTSAKKSYGTWQTDASRAAAWVNVMLETEWQTRGERRAFVPYPLLLQDWALQLKQAGEKLGLAPLAGLDRARHPEVDEFVDPSLFRNRTGWEGLEVPQRVVELAEEAWDALQGPDEERLGSLRGRYREMYAEAEAISHSSVIAVRPRKRKSGGPARSASLPRRVLRKLRG